jgi:hypothetical protein
MKLGEGKSRGFKPARRLPPPVLHRVFERKYLFYAVYLDVAFTCVDHWARELQAGLVLSVNARDGREGADDSGPG